MDEHVGSRSLPALELAFFSQSIFLPSIATLATAIGLVVIISLFGKTKESTLRRQELSPKKPSKGKRREITKCPFSSEVTFEQESAEQLPPSPLDLYGGWKEHLASRWLAAGLSGQDTPGYLRAGLKRLRHSKHFLVEDDNFATENFA